MREILAQLNKTQGVRGSMLVSRDGIVIASDFADPLDDATAGAISSAILAALDGALKRLALGKFTRAVITGSETKVALVEAGQAMLLVLLNRDANMGLANLEIKTAVAAVERNAKI